MNANLAVAQNLVGEVMQAGRQLRRSDPKFRFALEIGGMGLALMILLSLFGGSGGGSGGGGGASQATYNPGTTSSGASLGNAPAGGAPSISQAQMNALQAQTGGSVISTVPIAPTKIAPTISSEEVQIIEPEKRPADDPFTFRGEKHGLKPIAPAN